MLVGSTIILSLNHIGGISLVKIDEKSPSEY